MDLLLKSLGPKVLLQFLPLILIKVGNFFKNKDANTTGPDDAFGNILIAAAPAVEAVDEGNEKALRKALKVVRDTIDNYLRPSIPD